jgi:hypothetical protein
MKIFLGDRSHQLSEADSAFIIKVKDEIHIQAVITKSPDG